MQRPKRLSVAVVSLIASVAMLATACVSSQDRDGSLSPADKTPTSATSTTASIATGSNNGPETTQEQTEGSETVAGDGADTALMDESVNTMLSNLAVLYRASDGVWPGFDPNEHPTVVGLRSGTEITGAVSVNHPDPAALGNAVRIDTGDAPFTAHYISQLSSPEAFDNIEFFDFNSQQGGVDSFVMIADPSDEFLTADAPEFATTYIHEMFHRYQFSEFDETNSQDFENYPYTPENLELAALEGRALTAALQAETDAERDEAARRFAAIRMARREAFPQVALDDGQEIGEGSARFIEHLVATEDFGAAYHRGNVDSGEIPTEISTEFGVRETFGFGRFYATGAAALELLDRMGVPDYTGRVEANDSPATILADVLGVTDDKVADLVADAKANYDPLKQLADQAAEGAEAAKNEPPIFGESPDS